MGKKAVLEAPGLDSQFAEELAKSGIAGIFKRIPDRSDMTVQCVSTGLPRLDRALHPVKLGWPIGRDIEIYSKDPEVGKTSLGLRILRTAQQLGLRTAIVDIENTITDEYLLELGIELDSESNPNIYVPYLAKGYDIDTGELYSGEQILNAVTEMNKHADMVLVDSVTGMAKKSDLEKDAEDPTSPGGVGKIIQEYIRRNLKKRSSVFWINQTRAAIGAWTPPGMAPKRKTTGGDSIGFFASLRIELNLVKKLTQKINGEDVVYGVKVEAHIAKNKIAPPYRKVLLTYLNGRGFDTIWDLFEMALQAGIIQKKGSWLSFGDAKAQGDLEFYGLMVKETDLTVAIQEKLDLLAQEAAA